MKKTDRKIGAGYYIKEGQARILFGPFLIMILFLKQQFLILFTLDRSAKSTAVKSMSFGFLDFRLLAFHGLSVQRNKNILI